MTPHSIGELKKRVQQIAGLTLEDLANTQGIQVPKDLKRNKGWTGQLIESILGASAGSSPIQDFPELGVELKTLPIDQQGNPLETTYVCFANLLPVVGESWESSNVCNKLQHVLWIPVVAERTIPIAQRQIGSGFFWQANERQRQQLQSDWEEINDMIICGQVESISSRIGEVLQLRPKAINGKALTDAINSEGIRIKTRPRGYYLKKNFTREILQAEFDRY